MHTAYVHKAAAAGGRAARERRKRFRMNLPLLILFAPIAAFFIIFKYAPMAGLVIAFKNYTFYDGIWGSEWVGLHNFEQLFSNPQTLSIIRNTVLLSCLNIVFGFPFPILLAILLNEVRRQWFKRLVQTLVYLPHFLSWVIVGGMVVTIFSQETGIVNHLVKAWLGEPYPFLYKDGSWIAIFVGSGIWKGAGWGAIVYLAALTTIDPHLYEAASLDGASKWRQIWHVTLPGISSTIVVMFILTLGHVMEVGFDHVFMLQNSVVSGISEVISTYIYRVGLQGAQFSLTTAMGLFESLIGLVLVLTANRIARRLGQSLW
ncbi:ABC transporter permease subunit [Paenibacillus aurantius]|uniref:ABC transporter permease subunit n=2 Tax=Paenibacillus aurantius TaxID=2918900 RepID=A0AA96LCF4_9BACL|nr:ABC transporter permease subunit [Paenibacillus aurantius]WNQ10755.1 ABC transporter permease subunit [Paenibacillus aurantius]